MPAKRVLGVSTPCTDVDLEGGVAVVPDLQRPAHLLLVPTRRLAGIESAELQQPDAPNYWKAAWDARRFLAKRAGRELKREEVGLAVNSVFGRSQDQLHIHIACARADIAAALSAQAGRFSTERWARWAGAPGRDYRVRLLRGEDLSGDDPFRILAQSDPHAARRMGRQTLVVLGTRLPGGEPGFFLLAGHASVRRGDSGHSEELLDERCDAAPAGAAPQG